MARPKDVTPEIWEELKEGTKLYDWFNGDNGEVILDGKVWWLETIQYAETMTDDVHDELEKLMLNKYGANYLSRQDLRGDRKGGNVKENNMKYALTFTNPETYDWNETDTIIIDTPKNPLDIPLDDLAKALAVSNVRDYNEEGWKDILGNDSWYVRNCEDTDASLWGML